MTVSFPLPGEPLSSNYEAGYEAGLEDAATKMEAAFEALLASPLYSSARGVTRRVVQDLRDEVAGKGRLSDSDPLPPGTKRGFNGAVVKVQPLP